MSSDHTSRARLFRDALNDALDAGNGGDDPLAVLTALVERSRPAAGDDATVSGALEAFEAIAHRGSLDDALSEAASLFASPQRFREALFFLRCLDRDAGGALSLMRRRSYLSAAVAPASAFPELANDQAALLDATTFETLWHDGSRRAWMEDAIEIWRQAYQPLYTAHHTDYNRHMIAITGDVEAALWQTEALEKLNSLERLGEPVALPALTRFHDLAGHAVCPADQTQLSAELSEVPVCPWCGYRLGEVAPVEALNSALVAIERGLVAQQTRLERRVVSRLLARPGRAQEGRLERFIQVVQASDMSGLAQALDEGLLAFLNDLLQTPEPRVNLIDRLARDYPEVTPERLDEVVSAFRALMQDELDRGGGRVVIGREDTA